MWIGGSRTRPRASFQTGAWFSWKTIVVVVAVLQLVGSRLTAIVLSLQVGAAQPPSLGGELCAAR